MPRQTWAEPESGASPTRSEPGAADDRDPDNEVDDVGLPHAAGPDIRRVCSGHPHAGVGLLGG